MKKQYLIKDLNEGAFEETIELFHNCYEPSIWRYTLEERELRGFILTYLDIERRINKNDPTPQ